MAIALAVSLVTAPVTTARTPVPDRQSQSGSAHALLPSGPDPWIVRDGKTYYYMSTLGDRLAIRKTRDIERLSEAAEIVVWRPPAKGQNAQSIWAPELHRIGGKWYIYYSAAEDGHDDDDHRGVFILENGGPDPTRGKWVDRGKIKTKYTGIDGTTFESAGRRYFVYSAYVGPDSVLAIAKMANPWTLSGDESVIARPDRDWERQGGRQILEGPAFLRGPKGKLYLSYSGSACWSDGYSVGLLTARAGSDPTKALSWTKSAGPILSSSAQRGIYAPGHNGFFTSPDGNAWMVYHANPKPEMGCTGKRAPHIQRVRWDVHGSPIFTHLGENDAVPADSSR